MKITGRHLGIAVLLIFFASQVLAGPEHNHVHIEQVADGDNANINITQIGYDNEINFTFAHQNNSFIFQSETAYANIKNTKDERNVGYNKKNRKCYRGG